MVGTFTTPPSVTNGVSSVSAADAETYIRDNLKYIAQKATFMIDTPGKSVASGSDENLDLNAVGTEQVWDTDSLHTPTNEYVSAGGESGVWYVGGTLRYGAGITGDRRLELSCTDSALDLTRWRTKTNPEDGTVPSRDDRMSAGTAFHFNGTDTNFAPKALHTNGSNINVSGAAWGIWQAGTSSLTGVTVENLDADDDTSFSTWWNQWRNNILRLYRRPYARVRRSSDYTTLADATWTVVPFNAEDEDNAGMVDSDESVITIQHAGYYYCEAGVVVDGFTGSEDSLTLQFLVDGQAQTAYARSFDVNTGDGALCVEAILYLGVGDELSVRIYKATTGGNSTILAGHHTHMSALMVSGDVVAPNREYFVNGAPAPPSFSDPDSPVMPRGLGNLSTRDIFAHLWNPPVLGLQLTSTDDAQLAAGGWTDIRFSDWRYDGWNRFSVDADGNEVEPSGGRIELPFDGVWLVVGMLDITPTGVGDQGDRGVRIKHGGKNVAPIRTKAGENSSTPWTRTTSGLINARAGDTVGLQGLSSAVEEVDTDKWQGVEVDVTAATLVAVWVRDRVNV